MSDVKIVDDPFTSPSIPTVPSSASSSSSPSLSRGISLAGHDARDHIKAIVAGTMQLPLFDARCIICIYYDVYIYS